MPSSHRSIAGGRPFRAGVMLMMSDEEIVARNPPRPGETEDEYIERLCREKAKQAIQDLVDAGELVRLPDGGIIESERLN